MIFSIAWRNIWRSPQRSLVVLCAICLGLFGGVFSMAFTNGMSLQRIRSAISTEVADIQIHSPEFLAKGEILDTIPAPRAVIARLSALPGVSHWSSRIKINAMAASATTGTGVVLYGIDPADERAVSSIADRVGQGGYLADGGRNDIVVGAKLAQKLRVRLGSKIVLTMQAADGAITGGAFKIAGIYKTDNSAFDETAVFSVAADLRVLTGLSKDAVQEIAVRTADSRAAPAAAARLQAMFGSLVVESWEKSSPELALLESIMTYMMFLFLVIILVALAFGIVNTMLMAILERTRELGMLMAIGMTKTRIFAMIMVETVLLCLTGGAAGMAASAAAIAYFGNKGIDLSSVSRGLSALGYGSLVYPQMDVAFYVALSILIMATGIASSVYPALRALRLQPAKAIRTI
jgi:ABC-type lipoprotein release transport system permease subunit